MWPAWPACSWPWRRAAADLLAPGGVLLYATCTVSQAENEGVAAALGAVRPNLRLDWEDIPGFLGPGLDEEGYWRSWPPEQGCDTFFAARLTG